MNIRKGNPEDMKSVLGLIQELAIFEKEPDAVVITEEDLVRDGFGEKPLFQVFVAEIDSDENEVYLITEKIEKKIEKISKKKLSRSIIEFIAKYL